MGAARAEVAAADAMRVCSPLPIREKPAFELAFLVVAVSARLKHAQKLTKKAIRAGGD